MLEQLKHELGTRQGQIIAAVIAAVVLIGGAAIMYLTSGDEPAPQFPVLAVSTTTPTPTPAPTPSPTPRPEPTPEPTPPPYDGDVVRLSLPRLGIDHYIEPVGIINREMQAPTDGVHAIGWYYDFPKPGFGQNALFSAHETWNRSRGPFYALHLAVPGDLIVVTMDNGTEYHYEVMTNVRYDVDSIPMGEVVQPSTRPANEDWITLITCGGRIVYDSTGYGDYLDRDVVQARRIR